MVKTFAVTIISFVKFTRIFYNAFGTLKIIPKYIILSYVHHCVFFWVISTFIVYFEDKQYASDNIEIKTPYISILK